MKDYILAVFLLMHFSGFSAAEGRVPGDAEALAAVFSTGLHKILDQHNPLPCNMITISYSQTHPLSKYAQKTAEALLTSGGLAITDNVQKADCMLLIAITDARIILQKSDVNFARTLSMTIHVKCVNTFQEVLLAYGCTETMTDVVPKRFLGVTDNGKRFSKDITRQIIQRNHWKLMVFSFIILTGTLVYFAF